MKNVSLENNKIISFILIGYIIQHRWKHIEVLDNLKLQSITTFNTLAQATASSTHLKDGAFLILLRSPGDVLNVTHRLNLPINHSINQLINQESNQSINIFLSNQLIIE